MGGLVKGPRPTRASFATDTILGGLKSKSNGKDNERYLYQEGFVMAKARGKVRRSRTPEKALFSHLGEPEITIAAWCPDEEAKLPPEQVHLVFKIPGLEQVPLICRFKSPDTLGFIVEELTRYRREVWPDAEPVGGEW